MRRIGTGERVDHIERLLVAEEVRHFVSQALERVRGERPVAVPPDAILGRGLADDELVLWRAAGVLARVDGKWASLGDPRLRPCDRVLVEDRSRRIPDHPAGRADAVSREIHMATDVHGRHRNEPFSMLISYAR